MAENGARRSRRAIRLSVTDQRRLDAGEITDPTQALHAPEDPHTGDGDGKTPDGSSSASATSRQQRARSSAEDERILREVPPHFGPL